MPDNTVNTVLDLFFLRGIRVIFRVALTIFSMIEQDCLDFESFDEVVIHIQEFMMHELDAESLHNHFEPQISLEELHELTALHR